MSSINSIDIDLSKLSPSTLEVIAQIAFKDRVASFLPFLWLGWIDAVCMGLVLVVVSVWWKKARSTDRAAVRYLVYWMLSMVTAFSVTYQSYVLTWFASGFGTYRVFFESEWIKILIILGAALFYLHRAHTLLGGQMWIVYLVLPLTLFIAAAPIAHAFMLKMVPYSPEQTQVLAVSFICEMAADVIITTTIAWKLHTSKTGWKSTDRMIRKLLFSLAETQAPPTMFSLIILVLFYAKPNTTVQNCFSFSPKVGFLCILFTLLSRVYIAEEHARSRSGAGSGAAAAAAGKSLSSSWGTSTGGSSALGGGQSMGAVYYQQDKEHLEHKARTDRHERVSGLQLQSANKGNGTSEGTLDLAGRVEAQMGSRTRLL